MDFFNNVSFLQWTAISSRDLEIMEVVLFKFLQSYLSINCALFFQQISDHQFESIPLT